ALTHLSRLLWAAQGITGPEDRLRASPSAGATFPLEVYTAVGDGGVKDLGQGVYRYAPADHELERTGTDDIRRGIASAALGQDFVAAAPVAILLAAQYSRTTAQYGDRGRRYVLMEAGHASQNIYLQAESLGLVTVAVGAFRDAPMSRIYGLQGELEPLYLMPVGHPA
ncbi:MAG: SagB/ThcOx family dehydrogenase, partial [Planctomycetota bacterium]